MDIFEQNLTKQTSLAMVQTFFWGKISLSALCVHFHKELHLIKTPLGLVAIALSFATENTLWFLGTYSCSSFMGVPQTSLC